MTAPAPVLCWDIDGTLLTTARAGVYALERATREVTGRFLDLRELQTAGLTDVEIAQLILTTYSVDSSAENVRRFLDIYEGDLPASLHRRQGRVLPGVHAILEALRAKPDWTSILLTGNTRRGAAAKLAHYGLATFFHGGAFSDETENRRQIAENAVTQIRRDKPHQPCSHIVVIGDTPHDISCARAVGLKCLAVATGTSDVQTLEQHHPDLTLPELPDVDKFFRIIENVCANRCPTVNTYNSIIGEPR